MKQYEQIKVAFRSSVGAVDPARVEAVCQFHDSAKCFARYPGNITRLDTGEYLLPPEFTEGDMRRIMSVRAEGENVMISETFIYSGEMIQ